MREMLGYITKPQGVRGEFRLRPVYNNIDFKKVAEVEFKNKSHRVEKVALREGFVVMKVEGVDDRNMVETLRNVEVYFDAPERDKNTLFKEDFVDCVILSKQRKVEIGKVIQVDSFGAADVFTVRTANGEFMFPYARDVITEIDIENKCLIVDEYILNEIKSE